MQSTAIRQTTLAEKEEYLKGRRSKTVQIGIDKSEKDIPYEMQIALHYSYLKALDMVKRKASITSGSENTKGKY